MNAACHPKREAVGEAGLCEKCNAWHEWATRSIPQAPKPEPTPTKRKRGV